MFKIFQNTEIKKRELKYDTIREFTAMQSRCLFGTFQWLMFDKALRLLDEGADVTAVRKWLGQVEKDWNKL